MSYIINKTDGTILATVVDGQVDSLSTDLTLIGKNYSGFGESLNENFIKLLENFASTSKPARPLKGQIWFDSSEGKLKVYNGTSFVPVSSATVSSSQPSTIGVGDLWYDDVNKQLFFYDGTDTILLAPIYSATQGLSGLKVVNVLDSYNQTRVVTYLYTNGLLLGIFSKDSFTPKLAISGFAGDIVAGFNAGTIDGFKFNVTATNAEQLGNSPASFYIRKDTDNIINGQLTITSNRGVLIGDAQQGQFIVVDGNLQINNDSENKNIVVKVKRGAAVDNAVEIDAVNQIFNIYKSNESSQTYIGGDLTVAGNMTVEGEVVTVNTSTLDVEDKNIELAKTSIPTDEYADGGGIILKGASDKSFTWSKDLSGGAWSSSEHISIGDGKTYFIGNVPVIEPSGTGTPGEYWLGPDVTGIPGVTSFGPQVFVDVGPSDATVLDGDDRSVLGSPVANVRMRLWDYRISTVKDNLDLELAPHGTGNVALIGSPRITGLATPVDDYDSSTKKYVDDTVKSRPLVFSMDVSDGISNTGIIAYLTQLAPPALYENGTVAKILCTSLSNGTGTINMNTYVNTHTTEFITPDAPASIVPGGTAFGVDSVTFGSVSVPPPAIAVYRVVKTFVLSLGVWTI